MEPHEAYKKWLKIHGVPPTSRLVIGFKETSVGINIILRNKKIIPYMYKLAESQ